MGYCNRFDIEMRRIQGGFDVRKTEKKWTIKEHLSGTVSCEADAALVTEVVN